MQSINFYLKFSIGFLIFILSTTTLTFSASILCLSPFLPTVEKLKDIKLQIPLRIFSADHKLIAEFGEKKRQPISFQDIPQSFVNAILAAEDKNFFQHHGVDLKGLSRAFIQLIATGQIQSGGSTITMQVARNFFLTRQQTFTRKFNEILLAIQIERKLTKEEILELYINKIYLGNRAYGAGAAAQVYYGKPINDLSLPQLAMIAGLPKAPSTYNPLVNPKRALIRRDWILGRMLALNLISQLEYNNAINSPITAKYHELKPAVIAPYLAETVRQEIISKYGEEAYVDGYEVITTIDSNLQHAANSAIITGLQEYDQRHGFRGPESVITIPEGEKIILGDTLKKIIREKLNKYQSIGKLQPAVVIVVNPDFVIALLKSGTEIQIPLDSMKWAQRYITVNSKGPIPETAQDVLQVGDVIRVLIEQATTDTVTTLEASPVTGKLTQIPKAQAALVALNPQNGAIQAMVGGFNFSQSKYNRAINTNRQAGSSFKPFIYSAALHNGFTAASIINDAPVVFKDKELESYWRPTNSSGQFFGPTRLRKALYKSRNLVSIRLLEKVGISRVINFAQKFGFDKNQLPNNLSLALGTATLSPLDLAQGYAAFANGGFKVTPFFINKVTKTSGNIIFESNPSLVCKDCVTTEINELSDPLNAIEEDQAFKQLNMAPIINIAPRIIDERITYITRTMLQDVIRRGTGRKAKALGRNDLAGKTGTTNDQKDAWFCGFNRNIVTTVWSGFDQPQTLGSKEYGSTVALPIWIKFMRTALKNIPEIPYTQPNGLVSVRINPQTGKRVNPGEDAIFEIFRSENVPPKPAHNPNHRVKDSEQLNRQTLEELF